MEADAWWPNRLNTFFALPRLQVIGTNSISQILAGYHVTVLQVSWVKIRVETYQLLDNDFVVFFNREERLRFILHHVSLPCFTGYGKRIFKAAAGSLVHIANRRCSRLLSSLRVHTYMAGKEQIR